MMSLAQIGCPSPARGTEHGPGKGEETPVRELFISYVEEDGLIAQEIAHGLENAGYKTWYYERDGLPGPDYLAQVGQAIDQVQAVVLIISPDSLGSNQVTVEVIRAFESKKAFVPILRDITHAEFQQRQPVWRQALGAATSVRLPPEGVAAILPRIIAGLAALGIQPGEQPRAPQAAFEPRRPVRPPAPAKPAPRRTWPVWGTAAVVLAALIVAAAAWWATARLRATPTPTAALAIQPATEPAAAQALQPTRATAALQPPLLPTVSGGTLPAPTSAAPLPSTAVRTPGTILEVGGREVAWSPDGKWLAIALEDVYLYDAHSMTQARVIQTKGGPNGLVFSPDGKTLAVLSRGVTLYDAASGSEVRTLAGTENSTSATCSSFLSFSPDGTTLAVVVGDTVKLFDVATGKEVGTLVAKGVLSIAFASDGQSLFAGSWQGITVLDVAGGRQLRSFGDASRNSSCMALSAGGALLVSAGLSDGQMILWEAATGRQLGTLAGSGEGVISLAISPDARLVASAGRDVAIRLWDVAGGADLQTLVGHSRAAEALAFSPDGSTLASTSWDGTTRLWTLSAAAAGPAPAATRLAVGPRPAPLPLSGRAISVDNAAQVKSLNLLDVEGRHVAWSPDGKWLVIGGRQIHFYDAISLKEVRAIQADRWVVGLALSPDGQVLAAIDETRGVMLFDVASGAELRTLPRAHISTSAASNSFLAFSPDSATLAVILGDTAKLFDVAGGEEVGTIVARGAEAIAFSPDGGSLYAGGTYGVSVYDAAGGELQRGFGGVSQSAHRFALSAGGTLLASGGTFDEPMTLWEADSGRQLRTFPGHSGGINSLALSPDGRILASAAGDVTIKLWDVAGGTLLATLVGHTRAAESIAFSPDGATLASTAYDEGVWLWGVPQ